MSRLGYSVLPYGEKRRQENIKGKQETASREGRSLQRSSGGQPHSIILSQEQVSRLLVGREVEISVGEPWDFSSPDGNNLLRGHITEVGGGEDGDLRSQWVRIEVTPFEAEGGCVVDGLLAKRRYADPTGIIEQIASGEDADANLSYRDQVPEKFRDPRSSQFLVGGLYLAP